MRVKRIRRTLLLLLGIVLLAAAGMLLLNRAVRPTVRAIALAQAETAASRAMNAAISETLANDDVCALVTVRAQNGQVVLLETDSVRINRLGAACALCAQEKIRALGEQGVSVPLGTALNSALFSGFGPNVRVRFTPTGTVRASCESSLHGAGINQTLHRITLKLTATVRITLPGGAQTITVETEAPIAENVIVGGVPDSFASFETDGGAE